MTLLDPRTIYLITSVMYLSMPAVVYLALRHHRRMPVTAWTLGGGLFGVGLLLIGLRGIIADVISFEVAIFLIIVGNGLRVEALRRELGRPSTLGRITLAYSLGWLVYAVLRNIAAIDAKVSFCWAALVIAAGFIQIALLATTLYRRQALRTAIWLAAAYYPIAALLIARVIEVMVTSSPAGPLDPGVLASLVALSAIVACVITNTSFLGLYAERDSLAQVARAEAQARQEESARLGRQIAHLERQRGLGLLAESLAHELSQPLTNISLITDLERARAATASPALDDIQLNVRLASELLDRIRAYAKDQQPALVPLPLDEVVRAVARLMRDWLQSEHIEIGQRIEGAPLTVAGDRVQLSQVLLNLIRNAAEASAGQAARRIEIAAFARNSQAIVQVTDNGPGFGDAALARGITAFETTKPDGLGLGLSISQQIVRLHGGELRLANGAQGGAEVQLILERCDRDASA